MFSQGGLITHGQQKNGLNAKVAEFGVWGTMTHHVSSFTSQCCSGESLRQQDD